MLSNPLRYATAILYRTFIYPKRKKEKIIDTPAFFGGRMRVALPAATDIYLTGGKTHDSEIRLARFLIHHLDSGAHFLDIGAHYGYFSLLAAQLVGTEGRVYSFEASRKNHQILEANAQQRDNIRVFNLAMAEQPGDLVFYEFENMKSEYNSLDQTQFENEDWFRQHPPQAIQVPATSIDAMLGQHDLKPKIIKIDVEGAEDRVIEGARETLKNTSPMVVMEYLAPHRGNDAHKRAASMLQESGHRPHLINEDGSLRMIEDIAKYMLSEDMDSENVVFF